MPSLRVCKDLAGGVRRQSERGRSGTFLGRSIDERETPNVAQPADDRSAMAVAFEWATTVMTISAEMVVPGLVGLLDRPVAWNAGGVSVGRVRARWDVGDAWHWCELPRNATGRERRARRCRASRNDDLRDRLGQLGLSAQASAGERRRDCSHGWLSAPMAYETLRGAVASSRRPSAAGLCCAWRGHCAWSSRPLFRGPHGRACTRSWSACLPGLLLAACCWEWCCTSRCQSWPMPE